MERYVDSEDDWGIRADKVKELLQVGIVKSVMLYSLCLCSHERVKFRRQPSPSRGRFETRWHCLAASTTYETELQCRMHRCAVDLDLC